MTDVKMGVDHQNCRTWKCRTKNDGRVWNCRRKNTVLTVLHWSVQTAVIVVDIVVNLNLQHCNTLC